MSTTLVGGVTEQDANRVGLSDDERKALEAEDDEIEHDPSRPSKDEVERLEHELKKGEKDDDDPEAKAAEEKAAQAKADADAAAKAEADAKAKREAELAAMNEEQRKAAIAEDERKAAEAKKATERATVEDDEAEAPFVPTYTAPAVDDYEGKIAALDKRVTDAETAFKAGEIKFDDFRKVEREVNNERRALDDAKLKHDISVDYTNQQAAARWKHECDSFFSTSAKAGVDYKDPKNRGLWAALDTEVKELGKDPANADKAGPWFLREADRRVREQFNLAAAPRVDAGGRKDKGAAVKDARDQRKQPEHKPTLGALPAAEHEDTRREGGEFAHLEKLEGMELEAALAAMSKADADRYLAGR